MYEPVRDALRESESLAREGQFDEAEDVVSEINRVLMKASGAWDRMVKRFPLNEGNGDASTRYGICDR